MKTDPTIEPPAAPAARRIQQLESYLFFDGRCEEAIEFYRQALGAEVTMLMRFNESPEPPAGGSCAGAAGDKIMHATLRIGESNLMMSDGECKGRTQFTGFALSLTVANAAEAHERFDALANGGAVVMPLARTFFSSCFGMVTDRFGVSWMVVVMP
jgi:PhnB protein